ncbi:MAG TPA: 6-pyruvoyl-tetrahydropterin synthase-related protein [Thermoanaerobaculia bacterium]|jgi:hypothetical protein|nr:6-pyruvoyl-tetrahydropterin synthase-related protein [Thermoanaerobaculia bacterium]
MDCSFLLLAITARETAVQPRAIVAVAVVLLVGLLAYPWSGKPRRWLDLAAAALLGIAASHLLLLPGLPRGHDTLHHLWGVWSVAREARAGFVMPLWVHGLGLGMPLLQFYGLTAFAVSIPFSLAGFAPAAALKASFLTFGAVACMGMYLAADRWTGDRRAALVAAAAYAFAPYRLIDFHYRAAFGESAGLAVLPFVLLFGMAAVRDGGRRRLAAGGAAAALLLVTHPLSAMMTAIGMGVWTLAELTRDRQALARISRLAGVWLVGAALAGFFLVPLAAAMPHASVERLAIGEERSIFTSYGLTPVDLLERRPWTRLVYPTPAMDPRDGSDQEMPYYFGLALLALAVLGARRPAPRGLAWMTLAALALTMRPVAGAASSLFPPLATLQFPWRFLGLAACGASALAGAAVVRLARDREGRRWTALVPGALAALLALDALPYTGAADWFPAYQGFTHLSKTDGRWQMVPIDPPYPIRSSGLLLPPADPGIDTSYFCCAYPVFETPLARAFSFPPQQPNVLIRAGVGLFARPGTQALVRLPAAPYASLRRGRRRPEPLPFTRQGGEIRVRLDGRPGQVMVLEEYFPGWQVLTDEGWKEVRPNPTGLLRMHAARGQTEARFRFQRWTRPRIAGWLVTALTALGLAGMALSAGRPRRRADPPPGRG